MAEELQNLIDRIQKEAVDKAEKEAEQIIAQAKEKAKGIVQESEEQAKQNLAKADTDAQAFSERSTKTLEQAARDLIISIGSGVQGIFGQLVKESVNQAMSPEFLKEILAKVIDGFSASGGEKGVELLLNDEDKQKLADFFAGKFRDQVKQGVEIVSDKEIFKGFKVSFKDSDVFVDFSDQAIAESLANFLRPQLAEIVHAVAQNVQKIN